MDTLPDKSPRTKQPSRKRLMEIARSHAREAIDVLVEIMQHGGNDSARMGAAKTLLNKVLPDLKATELTGEESKDIVVKILGYGDRNKPTT